MLDIIHIIISILLCAGILLQTRVSGLSAVFGGSGGSVVTQRRGAELLIYKWTVALSVAFFALSVARWYIPTF